MNTESFRHDVIEAMRRQGMNAHRLARMAHIQQSSLYNFINGKALLSGEFVLRLMPYIYEPLVLTTSPNTPTAPEEASHELA